MRIFLEHAYKFNWHCTQLNLLLTRPPIEKFMPDKPPLPAHMMANYPKTLVLGLRGVTVRSEYKLGLGFEFKKRPGLSTFLDRMVRSYEVVVFGDEESSLVNEICEALDPEIRIISGRLGHESTLLKEGRYIKDLSYMNRDIKDIVCIEFDPEKFYYHQDNVIKVPEWTGDNSDRELIDLIPFLEHLAQPGLDVRRELEKFGKESPNSRFTEIQEARRDIIQQKRSSGLGGVMSKIGSSASKSKNFDEFDENKAFPSQFKTE
jgi:import inner membrane translocase subunit TIM50